uniref:RNA-directed DNA polymerase n=1 Tax=Fagus sylvatica TaxID=28930 RepID=A0A2N9HBH6_FAGSY
MEAGDNSAQPLSASERQLQALTANIQELARQSAADRREMQELAKQNQELMTLLRSRGEIPSPGQGQNAEEIPRNETGRNQNQNDEGSSAHQNREPHPSQVADPTRSAADARAAKLEEELKEMREQMKEMKSQVKAKAAKNLDMLVHRSESPFTKRIDEYPLPAKFKVPQLETFDGFKDPLDYLDSFRTIMRLHGVSDEIMCRTFPTNLRGSARTWFNQLETGSIDTFAQLSRAFIDNFIGGRRSARPANYLLNIRQREGESLRSYVQRFNKEAVQIDEPNEYVALTAFNAGLLKGDFLFQLCKDPPKSMSELMYEAQKFINAEDAFEARDEFLSRKRKEPEDSTIRFVQEQVFQARLSKGREEEHKLIQDNPDIKWPGKLRSDPTKRSKDLYCRFHRDHGHTTEDCFALKQQIEALIRQGKLGKFVRQDKPEVRPESRPPRHEENKNRQGRPPPGYHRRNTSRKSLKMDDQVISFSEDDARNIHHPHDDALVVTLTIAGFLTRRVLIDNGSSADIIYLPAYQQMKIDKEQLKPIDIPLVGFTGDKVKPLGVVSLIIEAGTYPKQVRTSVEFLVVDCPSAYNVIIGRPTLNKLRAVTFNLPSPRPEAKHQTMKIDEGHKLVEPTEELEVIALDDGEPSKTTSIGTKMDGTIREAMISFLKSNLDVFAWTHDDMPGIDPATICHKLNTSTRPAQKTASPYPRIDQLVDSTAGHRLLTFMDAFSGYNQIMMDDADQEKTSFITSKGLFCYKVMPFGLKNAGATYQRLMNKMFHHQIGRNVEVYVDDMLAKPSPLYLAVSQTAVSSALIREDGGTQLPVYYTSKAFQGAEERYPAMEKLALALAMNKPDAAGRLIQWAVELSEFDIEYHPRQAIKAQALADFIAEFTVTEDEPSEEKPGEEWEIEIDGSSVKGAGGVGIVFKTPEGHLLKHSTRLQYPTTNNEAEYEALLTGLRIAKELGANRLKIRSDSQLIVGQVNGEYEAREDRMTKYLKLVRNAMTWFDAVMLVQVPREQNTGADALAKLASSDEATDQYIEVQHSPSHLEEEVSPIDVSNSWMTPIVNYLEDETLPSDPAEARKLRARSTRFILIQGVLYKRGFSLPYLRCLDKAEANYVMREVHEGIYGNHSGARSLVHKLVRAGYYWPTMQKDAVSYVRACDKCQRFGNLIHSPPETLTPMTAPWPFAQWGLDIMGPLPVGRRQLKFLVVGIDYFTKWVEAEPLATITEKNIRAFVWKAIICRFGIPKAFISDNGRQFDNSPFREFCAELGIHNHYSSPGHPQANGQVEVTNRSLLKMIKTRLEGAKGLWPEELPNILWAYRTTARTPTGETPFRLTYGTEAVIPVEIGLTTWRTNNYDEESNDAQLRSNLDLVDEVRDQAEARTRVYQQRMARYYDRRVKHREFKVGDLVLRKVTLATKDPTQGKLGPTWEGPYRVVKFHRRGTYHLEKLDGDALPHPWNAEHLKKYYQ